MNFVIDSSFWVSLFLENEIHHNLSKAKFKEILEYPLFTPDFALIEIAATLARKNNSQEFISESLYLITQYCQQIVSLPTFLDIAIKSSIICRCRGADSVFIGLTKFLQATLITNDKEQYSRGKIEIKAILIN